MAAASRETTLTLAVGDRAIVARRIDGRGPPIVWLGGFKSDMSGTKAEALAAHCVAAGRAFLRFDYSGHGVSPGRFEDGTISRWTEEALAAVKAAGPGPLLVGSSMGGWIALLCARKMTSPPAGLMLIAPAADFTEELMWAAFSPEIRAEIEAKGVWTRPSAYDPGGYPITRALIEDGRRNLVLGGPIAVGCPVHILQGMRDEDVPWRHAMRLSERIVDDECVVSLIKDGDHRLSTPADLDRLVNAVEAMATRQEERR